MSSIGDPFLLSTYTHSRRKTKSTKVSKAAHQVFASYQQASSSKSDGFVTIAAVGDGVHVLDLSSLHPTVSHTLGPQSVFVCPAVTRTLAGENSTEATTYAVIESGSDISEADSGKTVWVWKHDPSGDLPSTSSGQKRSVVLPHKVVSVHAPDRIPGFSLFFGPNCEVTALDDDLQVKWTLKLPEEEGTLLHSFVFPRQECSFVPHRVASVHGVFIVQLYRSSNSLRVRTIGINTTGSMFTVGDQAISIYIPVITDATCSNSGLLSVITPNGTWYSFQLEISDHAPESISPQADPLPLRSLTFIPNPQPKNGEMSSSSPFSTEISLLSLGSSHVLLASISAGPTSEIVLLLWDLQYSVLLASHSFALPSTLSRSKQHGIDIKLVGGHPSNSNIILVLSPAQSSSGLANGVTSESNEGPKSSISSVLVVPVTVPLCSTLANAMGRATAGAKWIAQPPSIPQPNDLSAFPIPENLEVRASKVLRQVGHELSQKGVDTADAAFFKWVASEEHEKANRNPAKRKFIRRLEGMDEEERERDAKIELKYDFVKTLLALVFRAAQVDKEKKGKTSAKTEVPYSPKIVRFLLERGVVCDGMVEGGLLGALKALKDWDSMLLALRYVSDIPESDLISFLHDILSLNASETSPDDAMNVDPTPPSTPSPPAVSMVLSRCVAYTTSPPSLRLSLREHIKEPEKIDRVLRILLDWLDAWCQKDERFFPESVENNELGVPVPIYPQATPDVDLPPLDKILSFLQTLLDTSYLTLLTHPPSYPHLERLNSTLLPTLLSLTDDLQSLSGPLQPFVKAHSKALSDASRAASDTGKGKEEPVQDWRKRRKAAFEQAGIVGLYQLEELTL